MMRISLKNYANLLGYEYQGEEEVYFNKLVLDSRQVKPGDLFLALKGDNTDGHKYINKALENGAVGVVSLGKNQEIFLEKTNYIFVKKDDSLEEFLYKTGVIIKNKSKSKIVGITGSVGKTSTKDILYSVLKKEWNVIRTEGNFNNELGLPITMTNANEETDWMILEMGMRGLGEIRYLTEIAPPNHAIITSIEPVHAEILGNLENIAKAKAEITEKITEDGSLVINFKDKNILDPFLKDFKGKLITVGFSSQADYYIKEIIEENEKTTKFVLKNKERERIVKINTLGRHNMQNAALVCALGDFIGIKETSLLGLMEVEFSEMRFKITEISGMKIINDAYNANPSSTCFSLESLSKIEGKRKLFVFADMFELGDYEKLGHQEVGLKASELGVDMIFLLGEKVCYTYDKLKEINYNMENVFYFKDSNKLLTTLKEKIQKDDVILLKGSRGMQLENTEKEIKEFLNAL